MLMTCHRISTWHDRTCIQEQHRVWQYSKPPKMGFEGWDNQYICSKLIIQLQAPYSKLGGRTVMSRIITRRDKICSDIMNTMRTGIIRKHIITRDTIHCLWNDHPVHNTFPHCTHTGDISTRSTMTPCRAVMSPWEPTADCYPKVIWLPSMVLTLCKAADNWCS